MVLLAAQLTIEAGAAGGWKEGLGMAGVAGDGWGWMGMDGDGWGWMEIDGVRRDRSGWWAGAPARCGAGGVMSGRGGEVSQ